MILEDFKKSPKTFAFYSERFSTISIDYSVDTCTDVLVSYEGGQKRKYDGLDRGLNLRPNGHWRICQSITSVEGFNCDGLRQTESPP